MEITNAKAAREWLAAWGGKPRSGIAKATIDGLRTSASICRSYGNVDTAQGYEDAAAAIEESQR